MEIIESINSGAKRQSASVKRIHSPVAASAPMRQALHLPAQSAGHESLSMMRMRASPSIAPVSRARVRSLQRSST